jgi:hypothetical protein
MTTLRAGAAIATSWFPNTIGGFTVLMSVLLLVSWLISGRIFRERDQTTMLFRGMMSFLICIGIALFNYSSVNMILHGPLADLVKTKAERDAPLQENMRQWVTPSAYDACWHLSAAAPPKLEQSVAAAGKTSDAARITPESLVESAMKGLTWMALEHRRASPVRRNASPHFEPGTKDLNRFAAAQAQAMFDYIQIVSPASKREAQPFLADALAYCSEPAAPVAAAATSVGLAEGHGNARYPFILISRETPNGGEFVVRISPTETRVIQAATKAEALKIAKQP